MIATRKKHEMLIMARESGHDTIQWTPGDPVSVALARAAFDKVKASRASFYAKKPGMPQQKVTEFDESYEEIIIAPQLAGG